MAENTIQWDQDADGIVTLTLDDPTGSANVMNEHYAESMHNAVERLVAEKDSITGVVITSAKKTFFAGGDLKGMINLGPGDAQQAFDTVEGVKRDLRALETLGKPVVAAINGAALGGGFEIALACNHRIAVDGRYDVGLPEASLGLLIGVPVGRALLPQTGALLQRLPRNLVMVALVASHLVIVVVRRPTRAPA